VTHENRKDCYGAMFPETLHSQGGPPVRGKVFVYCLATAGGTFRSDRRVTADLAAWEDCVVCERFDACYRLSAGKLMLETALRDR
jgi:hypothetical protein